MERLDAGIFAFILLFLVALVRDEFQTRRLAQRKEKP